MKKNVIFKILSVLLSLCVIASMCTACDGNEKITMQDFINANKTENLMKYANEYLYEGSLTSSFTGNANDAEELIYIKATSLTMDYKYTDYREAILYTADRFYSCIYDAENAEYFSAICYDDKYVDEMLVSPIFAIEGTLKEQIVEQTKKDGKIILKTKLSEEDTYQDADEFYEEIVEGDWFEYEYIIDAETYILQQSSSYLCHKDGTKEASSGVKLLSAADVNENIKNLQNHLNSSDYYTLKIIFDSGKDTEKIYEAKAAKGDNIVIELDEDEYKLYIDEACTMEYAQNNNNEDLVLYAEKI